MTRIRALGLYLAIFPGIFLLGLLGRSEVILGSKWGKRLAGWLAPLYGGREIDALTVAYCSLYLIDPPILEQLIIHEGFHRFQSEREIPRWLPGPLGKIAGAAIYGVKFLLEYKRNGYYDNRFEREAREAAGQV